MEKALTHFDVNLFFNDNQRGGCTATIKASPEEAFALLSMPCLSSIIVSVVPHGLPAVHVDTDKE